MSLSPVGTNVLRWSALAVGVFYGFSHQASITAREKSAKIKHEYDQQESLIQKAKAEWAKKNSPAPTSSGKADPMDPNADLNVVLGITDN